MAIVIDVGEVKKLRASGMAICDIAARMKCKRKYIEGILEGSVKLPEKPSVSVVPKKKAVKPKGKAKKTG